MTYKEIISKLTPAHFGNGESFDLEAFASLKEGLQKARSNAWKMPVIFLAGLLLSFFFSAMGGVLGNGLAVACIFAGLIGGNLSILGISRQIKSARKTLGITQGDINAAVRKVKQQAATGESFDAEPVPASATATPAPAGKHDEITKKWITANTVLIASGVLVIMIHVFMVCMFIANAIDGDSKTSTYSIFALGSVIAIVGAILVMKKRLWAFALVVLGIVLFFVSMGMSGELDEEGSIAVFVLMLVLSALMLIMMLRLRRKEGVGAETKFHRLTRWGLLAGAGIATAVVLAIALWPKWIYAEKYYFGYPGTPEQYIVQLRETGKWGVLGKNGQEVVPCKYDGIERGYSFIKVKSGDRWGLLDRAGKELVPCKYDFIHDKVVGNLVLGELNGKKGYINYIRDIFLPMYEEVESYGPLSRVRLNGKWGLIHADGQEIIPIKYDELKGDFHLGLLRAKLDGRYGVFNLSGKEILPIRYDNVHLPEGSIIGKRLRAELNKETLFFDLSGQRLNITGGNLNVQYDAKADQFTFLDALSGKPLIFTSVLVKGKKPEEIRYGTIGQGSSAIQFVWKEARPGGSATVTTSIPLYLTLPYEIENGVLKIQQ